MASVAEASILVVGHVRDISGRAVEAQQLSEQRAQVVADAFVAGGMDRARITTRGLGAHRPLTTPAANRRVEISVG